MQGALTGKRILLVEDNAEIQKFISTVARLEGIDLATASNGEEALAFLADDSELDLILLDLNLPGIQGWDVLQEISSRTARDPQVVVFSAYTDVPTRNRAADLGAIGFIAKPVGARQLVKQLEGFLPQS